MISVSQSEGSVFRESVEVVLGGRTYELHKKLGRKHTRKFRKTVEPIVNNLKGLGGLLHKQFSGDIMQLDKEDWDAIADLVKQFSGEEFDIVLDMVYEWEPLIMADKPFLEGDVDEEGNLVPLNDEGLSGATDLEFVKAFFEIVKFVYGPFVENFLGITVETPQEVETQLET